jgi:hypothetical protein
MAVARARGRTNANGPKRLPQVIPWPRFPLVTPAPSFRDSGPGGAEILDRGYSAQSDGDLNSPARRAALLPCGPIRASAGL